MIVTDIPLGGISVTMMMVSSRAATATFSCTIPSLVGLGTRTPCRSPRTRSHRIAGSRWFPGALIDESELWQALPEYTNNSYDEWKKAVLTLYPGAMEDHKWSMADLDQLLGSTSHMGIMNSDEYTKYYHKFFTITQFLIGKSRLSELEQSRLFQQGFQPSLWAKIEQ